MEGLPRKAYTISPYRKPTQVSGMSILRRVSEPSLRNSANWPCIFGKKGAPRGAAVTKINRLFSKNTALCKHASGRIGSDT
jgi:hypothetical protein